MVRPDGTSPRGWGKVHLHRDAHAIPRNIPTRVGKRTGPPRCAGARSEHPHAGGEKVRVRHPQQRHIGTSPRGWGKGTATQARRRIARNIPTRVGKSSSSRRRSGWRSEHPHAGGEKRAKCISAGCACGTSPRGWGKGNGVGEACLTQRNIPTRVGKRSPGRGGVRQIAEHPHAGGEKTVLRSFGKFSHGTSPRGWGKAAERLDADAAARNIPTRVGKRR